MAVHGILLHPDPRLARPSEPVTSFDDGLRTLVNDLLDTMAAVRAVGLTTAHFGVPRRVVAIRLDLAAPPLVLINPAIVWHSDGIATHTEGSVSMPGLTATVSRPERIRVAYQDIAGSPLELQADGFLSACVQHEIDQLDGVFWIERLSRLKRDRLVKSNASWEWPWPDVVP
jgi:peptide deformylase